jgi:hypothetical protein
VDEVANIIRADSITMSGGRVVQQNAPKGSFHAVLSSVNYRHSTAEGIDTQQGSHSKLKFNVVRWVGG